MAQQKHLGAVGVNKCLPGPRTVTLQSISGSVGDNWQDP